MTDIAIHRDRTNRRTAAMVLQVKALFQYLGFPFNADLIDELTYVNGLGFEPDDYSMAREISDLEHCSKNEILYALDRAVRSVRAHITSGGSYLNHNFLMEVTAEFRTRKQAFHYVTEKTPEWEKLYMRARMQISKARMENARQHLGVE